MGEHKRRTTMGDLALGRQTDTPQGPISPTAQRLMAIEAARRRPRGWDLVPWIQAKARRAMEWLFPATGLLEPEPQEMILITADKANAVQVTLAGGQIDYPRAVRACQILKVALDSSIQLAKDLHPQAERPQ